MLLMTQHDRFERNKKPQQQQQMTKHPRKDSRSHNANTLEFRVIAIWTPTKKTNHSRWKRLISSFHVCVQSRVHTVIITQNFRLKPYVALVINLISRNVRCCLSHFTQTAYTHTQSAQSTTEKMQIGHKRFSWNWPFVSLQIISVDILSVRRRWELVSWLFFVSTFFSLSLVSVNVIWFRNLSNGFCCCSSHRSLDVGGWSFGPSKLRPCQKEWKIRRNKREKCSILSITPTSPRLFFHLIDKEKRRTTKLLSNVHNDR